MVDASRDMPDKRFRTPLGFRSSEFLRMLNASTYFSEFSLLNGMFLPGENIRRGTGDSKFRPGNRAKNTPKVRYSTLHYFSAAGCTGHDFEENSVRCT